MRCNAFWLSSLALLFLAGCHGDNWREPAYEIEPESAVVVMPFKDPDYRSRWDTPNGHDLAGATTEVLKRNAEFLLRPYQDVIDLLSAEEDVRKLTARDVAALCRADYVLVCDLVQWDPHDEKGVGITQGTATTDVRLFKVDREESEEQSAAEAALIREQNEVRGEIGMEPIPHERGGEYVFHKRLQSRFPSDYATQYGQSFLDPEQARRGLVGETAKRVARLFFAHDAGPSPLSPYE